MYRVLLERAAEKDLKRIRVGDYRVIYEIADEIRLYASIASAIAAKFIVDFTR